ncbi:isoflavone reductase family protein-like protein CipA [Amniculicola lignicola CBS 123094]|uniref:Isoflavone reductase family protein-like protein CipA n=1 Tax=Amniculicola lignicola CBS 123094 TaxID=1392246 RepID=A0A6A5WB47_9PLEO|nr:isoflavone reductase family protein-like protein CipA [Amniculicola lignicola CBS 123094]
MSSEIKNVIIVGASGNLGPAILNAFLKSSFNVSVLSRESSTATFPDNVKVIKADYDSPESLTAALKGQDAVVSLYASAAIGDQTKLIDAAIAAGVKHFIPSEYGSNTTNPKLVEVVPVFAGKVATVNYLKSKESVINWSAIVTGPFFDWGLKVGFLGLDIPNKKATVLDGGKGKFSTTNLNTIGEATVKVLEKAQETKNQYIFISSFTPSLLDIVAIAEEITGEKWPVTDTSSKNLVAEGRAKLEKHDYSGIVDLIKGSAFGDNGYGDHSSAGLWNEKLGLSKDSLEESIKAVLNGKLAGEA